MAKRAFDVAATSVALLLLALPLLLLGVAVRLDSPGPALFRQERVGRHGRRFRIWKLRTMVHESRGSAVTTAGDARVTRLGRILRRYKLDELPQLVNVWLGDMSLVGPRPEVPRYVAAYTDEQRRVLSVRPGITDPASLRFRDEERVLARFADPERAYAEVVLPLKLDLACEYVQHHSFVGDLRLILETLTVIAPRTEHAHDDRQPGSRTPPRV
jgi:lipopolysaccharide/colanic/teichoic acid biosynthesis glycosyltransferase